MTFHPFDEAVARLARPGIQLFFDVSPLLEHRWTGIPTVTAALARELLAHLPLNVEFFVDGCVLDHALVRSVLEHGGGAVLAEPAVRGGRLRLGRDGGLSIGLFPSVKSLCGAFDVECSIVHDISTVLMPEFHVPENVRHHAQTLVRDVRSNDVTVCVSEAVRSDLIGYLGVGEAKVAVAHNGVAWPWWFPIQADNDLRRDRVQPYFMLLGTREPRKNFQLILEHLRVFPELLDTHQLVITGQQGWLMEDHPGDPLVGQAIARERILFTGFVSNFVKYKLLRGAEALIYPSLLEGFGLPVLESLSAGTPCIASFTSSVPEIGGDHCIYFDPLSVADLHRAIRNRPRPTADVRRGCQEAARRFTWAGMMHRILDAIGDVVDGR